jgi:hypothetical protein
MSQPLYWKELVIDGPAKCTEHSYTPKCLLNNRLQVGFGAYSGMSS